MTTTPCPHAHNVIMVPKKGSLVALLPLHQGARQDCLDRIPMAQPLGDTEGRLFRTWQHVGMRYKEADTHLSIKYNNQAVCLLFFNMVLSSP